MLRPRLSLPLLILLAVRPAAADDAALSIEAAVRSALANNPAVTAAAAQADAAAARAQQARGHRLPSVDFQEMYNRTDSPAESFAFKLNQERFDMMQFFQSNPNNPDPLDTWMTRLEVTQPIYTGGKLSARIDQAGAMAEAARLELSRARQQVAFDTITAYTNLRKAREYLELMKSSRETTRHHVKLARQYAGQGMIVEAEVLKAQVYLAQMDEMVETAESHATLAESALDFHMGIDQRTHQQLAPPAPAPAVSGDLDSWIAAALDRRRDLGAARRKLDAGRLEEQVARAAFLPEVAAVGRYDLYDDRIFGSHGDSSTLMAVARINLFRGGADRSALAASRHDTASHAANISRFEEGIRLQVKQAWQELETAKARHATAAAALSAADEQVRVREKRFQQGLDKMIDLLDAETGQREAKVRALVARYDEALATYQLHYASGAPLTSATTETPEENR